MRCFYHQDREAVGGCKSCGKGLCPECAVDLQKGLACRGHCEADVQAVIALVDRNLKLSPTTSRLIESGRSLRFGAAIFHLAMGLFFVVWGFQDTERFSFIIILGVCFLAYGGYGFLQARRFARERKPT
jgi:hypothetical protein